MEESQEHRDAWARVGRMWDSFDNAEENDLIAAMARAARQAGPEPAAKPFWPQLVAASVALLIVSATLFVGAQHGLFDRLTNGDYSAAKGAPPRVAAAGYVTGEGQKSTVTLPDGTRVILDANSALDVAFATRRRGLHLLKGHAFFDVAHDAGRPFIVQAGGRTVTALGTQFDVQLAPGNLRVVLVDGQVSVASAPAYPSMPTVRLAPGQMFAVQDGAAGKVGSVDLEEVLAWKQGVVAFHDQQLSEAIGLLNRETRAQIVIKDPKVAALRITGVFKTGDIKRFGRSVSQVLPVKMIARDANTYELVLARR